MSASAPCPACGRGPLLVNATSLGVLTEKGVAVPWYGNPQYGFVSNNDPVECNRSSCGWRGTVKQARSQRKTENSNPND